MAILIFCIDRTGAKVFHRSNSLQAKWDAIELFHPKMRATSKNENYIINEEYARYLVSEIEMACSQNTTISIVLCAETPLLAQLFYLLTPTIRARLIGTIRSNMKFASSESLSVSVNELIGEKKIQVS